MISLYESMVEISRQMLEAARRQDWDGLGRLEVLCQGYIHQIPVYDERAPLSHQVLEKKVAMLKKILSNDKEIRELMEPWMARLNQIMGARIAGSSKSADKEG